MNPRNGPYVKPLIMVPLFPPPLSEAPVWKGLIEDIWRQGLWGLVGFLNYETY